MGKEFVRIFIKNQHLPKDTGWTQQLTNDAGTESEDWGLEALKETLNKRLMMSHKGNLTEIMCDEDVPWNYIYDTFTEADIIVVTFDKKGRKIGSVRGFACIKVKHNDKKQPFLYIDLICNAIAARTRAAKHTYPTGTTMLAVIKALADGQFPEAVKAGVPKCDFIKLRALETVITYYSLFGWEFLGKDDNTACSRPRGQTNRITKQILKKLRKIMENPASTEGQRRDALKPFNTHLDNFYKDKDISTKEFKKEQEDMDGWTFSGTREARNYAKRSDGYTMYKCLTGDRSELHNEIEKNRKGDYRLSLRQVGINKTADIELYYGRKLPRPLRPVNTDNTAFSIFRRAEEGEGRRTRKRKYHRKKGTKKKAPRRRRRRTKRRRRRKTHRKKI